MLGKRLGREENPILAVSFIDRTDSRARQYFVEKTGTSLYH
jgi:hypothetical protein